MLSALTDPSQRPFWQGVAEVARTRMALGVVGLTVVAEHQRWGREQAAAGAPPEGLERLNLAAGLLTLVKFCEQRATHALLESDLERATENLRIEMAIGKFLGPVLFPEHSRRSLRELAREDCGGEAAVFGGSEE